ncbi:hypothetical protein [Tsukamurella sp. PLM1]|uniref:hypothetical protein n=1 Tax=Tsukamurella sp. PLM1 TaxID=2929795 RepID=UPI0020C189A7|nr:hypothetical protein [Tsukamurella sp. PLM1]
MFTPTERQDVANRMIAAAEGLEGVTAGAVVGAAAAGALDDDTGIDLLLAAAPGAVLDELRGHWTRLLHNDFGALHHTREDGALIYLLPDLLTARVTIVPGALFGPRPGNRSSRCSVPPGRTGRRRRARRTWWDPRGWPRSALGRRCAVATVPRPRSRSTRCGPHS